MVLKDQNPNTPSPWTNYFAYLSALLGVAACITAYGSVGMPLSAAPCAIGFGLWAKHKGAKGWALWVGIIGGCLALAIVALHLYAVFSSIPAPIQ